MVYHFDICYHAAFRIDRHSFNVQIRLCGRAPYECESHHGSGIYSVVSFFICLIIVLLILRTAPKQTLRNGKKASAGMSVLWAVAGIWLALFSQGIAGMIEQYVFHVGSGSENTKAILNIIKAMPLMIIVSSIVGRFLKKSFSGRSSSVYYMKNEFLYRRTDQFRHFRHCASRPHAPAAVYSMGFTFAFLYVQTKRIIVPIFAHVMMNTIVVVMQLIAKIY